MKTRALNLFCVLILMVFMISGCKNSEMQEYYSVQDNYVSAEGIVSHIAFSEDNQEMYIEFSNLIPAFDDTCFKIVGKNLDIIRMQDIDTEIQLGDKLEFMTAPHYFGDGYVMPIVSLTIDGNMVLEFEEGVSNFLDWLK